MFHHRYQCQNGTTARLTIKLKAGEKNYQFKLFWQLCRPNFHVRKMKHNHCNVAVSNLDLTYINQKLEIKPLKKKGRQKTSLFLLNGMQTNPTSIGPCQNLSKEFIPGVLENVGLDYHNGITMPLWAGVKKKHSESDDIKSVQTKKNHNGHNRLV